MNDTPNLITLTIDGNPISVSAGSSVLDAILTQRPNFPHLCKDDNGPPLGACRTCLVNIEGMRGFPASCHTPARNEMIVQTQETKLIDTRRGILELTLAMQDKTSSFQTESELLKVAETHQANIDRWSPRVNPHCDETNPFYRFDASQCILCGRCTSACSDLQHIGAIGIAGVGIDSRIAVFNDESLFQSSCTSCGQCVASCPTGALHQKHNGTVEKTVSTVCPYCGVGCGIQIGVDRDGQIVKVDDDPANQSSLGLLCVKGRYGTTFVNHPNRLTTPYIRKSGELRPASWDEALNLVADKFVEYRSHFGALASAKSTNEDNYLLQKFVRLLMETNNIDHCTRLCHSPSVEAMLGQLGSGATSNSYSDFEMANCIMIVGADPSSNHPVIASRIRKAIDNDGVELIIINPKRIELCDRTDLWMQPNPGTDVTLLNGMANVIIRDNLVDEKFVEQRTEGFKEWCSTVETYTPEHVEKITGVPVELLIRSAHLYAKSMGKSQKDERDGSCLLWGMGITQHTNGTDNATALLNLALVSGQLGGVGNGISPLRGQNNVQGAGDMGCLPDALPGYQGYTDENIGFFDDKWGKAPPISKGLQATDMIEGITDGLIQCMYIVGENPMLTEPNLGHTTEAIGKLAFLVVQDIFMHETATKADVVLPATSFAEKEGTFTNSERRVQRVRKVVDPVGESHPDWKIIQDLALRIADRLGIEISGFDHQDPNSIFEEISSVTPILGGLSHERLDREGGIQWPCPTPKHLGTPRMYDEAFPRGKGRFVAVEQKSPSAEEPDDDYPFILNTGRVLYHWHGGTLTRHVDGLIESFPQLRVAIHPSDVSRLELANGDPVRITSRRGEMEGVVFETEDVAPFSVFVPFTKLKESAANWLTNNVYDESSRIPEFKVCAVSIERVDAPKEWQKSKENANWKIRRYW